MNIVHLTWTLSVGGAEEMLVDIVNQQCRTERVSVVVVNDIVDARVLGRIDPSVQVNLLRRTPKSRGITPFLRLNWLIRRARADVVHAHSFSLARLLPQHSSKLVLTVHTTADSSSVNHLAGRYDAVFAISEAVAAQLNRAKVAERRAIVVVNGIASDYIRVAPIRYGDSFRLVQVARLEHTCKGQDVLLRALARLRDRDGECAISLDFIGSGESLQMLEEMTRELYLEDCVHFRGAMARSQLYDCLCEYDLLVQPSRYEGFGLAVVEAMVAGVPVLVSDLEGPAAIIEQGRYGFLFRADDDAACAAAIEEIRAMRYKDVCALQQRAQAAREHALEQFDVRRTAQEYLHAYRNLLGLSDAITADPVSQAV